MTTEEANLVDLVQRAGLHEINLVTAGVGGGVDNEGRI
jgi:hypothetical protein